MEKLFKLFLIFFVVPFIGCSSNVNLYSPDQPIERVSEDTYQQVVLNEGASPILKRARLPLPKPKVEHTPEVEKEIKFFSKYNASTVRKAIERKNTLGPVIEKIFIDYGVPLEMMNVAIIESSFNPNARSSSGAVGLWQFMKSTGKVYGLDVGLVTDERKDPVKSTIAAARHLRDLYRAFEDWNLVLAAYNAGSGGIDRAVIRAGTSDFWELSRKKKLKAQTRRYVAKFHAVQHITDNPEMYGLGQLRLAMNYTG